MDALRNIIWTIIAMSLVYGIFVVLIPFEILSQNMRVFALDFGSFRYCGLVFIIGAVINLKYYWDLVFTGKGSPDPLIPTTALVSRGIYQYTRNPVYIGFSIILLGEAVFFTSFLLLIYSILWLLVFIFIVVFIEEPSLKRRYGQSVIR
ncbi:MAG TPA: hypothetical protein ENL37_10090 [Desulfobacteraceae bacterium]|nr:hypothetical protein [Desulfobacteraceae bacterium]